MGKLGLVDGIGQSPLAEDLRVTKPVYVKEMEIDLHSTATIHILALSLLMFPFHCE